MQCITFFEFCKTSLEFRSIYVFTAYSILIYSIQQYSFQLPVHVLIKRADPYISYIHAYKSRLHSYVSIANDTKLILSFLKFAQWLFINHSINSIFINFSPHILAAFLFL